MAALGTKAYRSLFPVLALLFLMVPAGDILLPVLMTATVQSMALFPILAGLPYGIDGFVITVAGRHYVVVEACSGLALVTTATFLGYSIGLLMFRSPVRALLLALFSATLAFLCNAARVNAIVIVDYLRGSQMEVAAHTPIQWLALAALLAGLFYVVHRTASDKAIDRSEEPARSVAGSAYRFAPVIAGAAGLLVTGSVLAFASDASLAHAPHPPSQPSFAGWAPGPGQPAWADDAATGIRSLRMTYVRGGATLEAAIVEAATPAAKLTEAVLLPADTASWHRRGASARQVCAQGRCLDVVHATWVRQEKTQWRHAYYLYSTGSFASGSKLMVRAMHGWQRLTRAPSASRLVGLVASAELDPAEATAVLQGLLAQDAPGARAALD
jgi:exosortase/archaeosortase family protein